MTLSPLTVCRVAVVRAPGCAAAHTTQVFLLCIKADVENIASLQPEEHHRWCLDVRSHQQQRA